MNNYYVDKETAKKEAERIYSNFYMALNHHHFMVTESLDCALICINEMINSADDSNYIAFLEEVKNQLKFI